MHRNVLIVEDDTRIADGLKSYLSTKSMVDMVESVPSVSEAIVFLDVEDIDVVVLDLIMPAFDGYYFMETLNKAARYKKPDIIVVSAINNENAIKKAFDMGAKYYMVKPYENEIMYQRIIDVTQLADEPWEKRPTGGRNIDQKIMEIFLSIGLPPHLKGYQYLRAAIKLVLEDNSMIYSITKRLYPEVAKQFDVTATKVELAIRHTLDVAWQRNKVDLNKIFGCEVYLKNNKPTNGEFIALIADKLATDAHND